MQSKCAPLNVRKGYFRDVFAQDEPNVCPIARGVDGLGSLERGDASVAAFEDRRSQTIYVQVGSRDHDDVSDLPITRRQSGCLCIVDPVSKAQDIDRRGRL